MKIIIENSTNLVKYLLNDSDEVTMESNRIVLADNVICDLNSNNATLIENVENKEDFSGDKYTYSDGTWTLNADWEDPRDILQREETAEETRFQEAKERRIAEESEDDV